MDFQEKPVSAEKTKLCSICQQFYGNIHTDFLCSTCYKKNSLKSKPEVEKTKAIVDLNIQKPQTPPLQGLTTINQSDSSKCWNCSRKVGLLGYKCKCSYIYCKFHRLPEEHDCSFDFKTIGKNQLKEANPLIKPAKIDKI